MTPKFLDWISVDSKLPDLRESYKNSPLTSGRLLIWTGAYVSIGRYEETYTKRLPRWLDVSGRVVVVTHWMDLPSGPK
jgi:hypothetical protein